MHTCVCVRTVRRRESHGRVLSSGIYGATIIPRFHADDPSDLDYVGTRLGPREFSGGTRVFQRFAVIACLTPRSRLSTLFCGSSGMREAAESSWNLDANGSREVGRSKFRPFRRLNRPKVARDRTDTRSRTAKILR